MKKLLFFMALSLAGSGYSQMSMTSAAMLGTCDCYQLTTASAADKGAIWSPVPIDLTEAFDMTFDVYLGTDDEWGADGIAFVLQQNGTGIGDIGYSIGYNDPGSPSVPPISANSFAIEIDTWNSNPTVVSDIDSDHLGVHSNGNIEHNLGGPYPIANIEDGMYHEFRVIWDPALDVISVFLDGAYIFAITNDIVATIFGGNPTVYFGFTGSTGGAVNEQRVCMYRNASFSADATDVCSDVPVTFTENSTSDLNNILSYSWDFGDGSPLDGNQNTTHAYAAPGDYTAELTITDVSGCTDVTTVEITVLPDLIIDVVGTDVSCIESTDGEAVATSQNGTGPFDYLWDDGTAQTTQTAANLSPGSYSVMVTDDLGCEGTGMVTIGEPTEIFITGDVTYDDGTSNGAIDVTITGGTTPYTSTVWSNSATTEDISGLTSDSYTITVTDANGCTKDTTFVLKSSVGIEDQKETPFTIMPNPSGGTFQISFSGFYDVIIIDASGRTVLQKTASDIAWIELENVASGIYTVQIIQNEISYFDKIVIQ